MRGERTSRPLMSAQRTMSAQRADCADETSAPLFNLRQAAALLLLVLACSKPAPPPAPKREALPAPPTAAAAQELIANAPEFGDYQFTNAAFTFAQKKPVMSPLMLDGAKRLSAAKWIRLEGDEVVLTDKAKSDKRFLVRPNGFIDVVPLAKKEMIGVTSVKQQPDGLVLAEFSWKWMPNEIGSVLGQPSKGDQKATAKLMWDGTAWTVLGFI